MPWSCTDRLIHRWISSKQFVEFSSWTPALKKKLCALDAICWNWSVSANSVRKLTGRNLVNLTFCRKSSAPPATTAEILICAEIHTNLKIGACKWTWKNCYSIKYNFICIADQLGSVLYASPTTTQVKSNRCWWTSSTGSRWVTYCKMSSVRSVSR